MSIKSHLTIEGYQEITQIESGMNKARYIK